MSSVLRPDILGVAVTASEAPVVVADQISASPSWVLERTTRVQVRPPPLTFTVWSGLSPSAAT